MNPSSSASDPSSTVRTFNRAVELATEIYRNGAVAQALEALEKVPSDERAGRGFLLLYGACLARSRRSDDAIATFTKLLQLEPECFEALTWMGVLLKGPDRAEEAEKYAREAIRIRPDDASGYAALGTALLSMRKPAEAIEAFHSALKFDPNRAEHRHNLGLAYLMAHQHREGIKELREAIALAPNNPQSYLVLASTYGLYGLADKAIECLTEGLKRMPDYAPLHTAAASAFAMIRNDAAAERHHQRAVILNPASRSGLASWLLNQGRFDDANTIFDAMIAERSDQAFAFYGRMQSRKLKGSPDDDAFVEAMQAALQVGEQKPTGQMYLHYALGKAQEQRREYQESMAQYDAANRFAKQIYLGGFHVDQASFLEEHRAVQRLFEKVRAEGFTGNPTESPICIIGMIRSGTTLLDQIVSSHSEVASGGELRFWLEETGRLVAGQGVPDQAELVNLASEYVEYARLLAKTSHRVTDKMPLNFGCAGLMHLAMPNARFLHIRRHPVDTCLSIWKTFFGQGPVFPYDKANIVAYYQAYLQSMDYWREVLPTDRLLELDYEDLIADSESTIRKVIEFCGLPWEDACLHHDKNDAAINTPSRWQARQPIYKTSMEQWRKFEPWLGEFSALLATS